MRQSGLSIQQGAAYPMIDDHRITAVNRYMEHPCARECVLKGNPLHADQLEILDLLECEVYGVNVVLNEAREISHVSFGKCTILNIKY